MTNLLKSFVRPASKETLAEPQEGREGMTMRATIGQVQQLSQNNQRFHFLSFFINGKVQQLSQNDHHFHFLFIIGQGQSFFSGPS